VLQVRVGTLDAQHAVKKTHTSQVIKSPIEQLSRMLPEAMSVQQNVVQIDDLFDDLSEVLPDWMGPLDFAPSDIASTPTTYEYPKKTDIDEAGDPLTSTLCKVDRKEGKAALKSLYLFPLSSIPRSLYRYRPSTDSCYNGIVDEMSADALEQNVIAVSSIVDSIGTVESSSGNNIVESHSGNKAITFPFRLYAMLDRIERGDCPINTRDIVSWQPHGRCFVVHQPKAFEDFALPLFFPGMNKWSSFQRQVRFWPSSIKAKGTKHPSDLFRSLYLIVRS
jgi:HSF-type DNA-binding